MLIVLNVHVNMNVNRIGVIKVSSCMYRRKMILSFN